MLNPKSCRIFATAIAKVAQLVEHNLAKVRVAGSSPVFRSTHPSEDERATKLTTKIAKVAQLVEHNLAKVRVAGSSPVFRSHYVSDASIKPKWRNW